MSKKEAVCDKIHSKLSSQLVERVIQFRAPSLELNGKDGSLRENALCGAYGRGRKVQRESNDKVRQLLESLHHEKLNLSGF